MLWRLQSRIPQSPYISPLITVICYNLNGFKLIYEYSQIQTPRCGLNPIYKISVTSSMWCSSFLYFNLMILTSDYMISKSKMYNLYDILLSKSHAPMLPIAKSMLSIFPQKCIWQNYRGGRYSLHGHGGETEHRSYMRNFSKEIVIRRQHFELDENAELYRSTINSGSIRKIVIGNHLQHFQSAKFLP